ncbi:MAG: STAS domain-containing protein [Gemmataceae bacterium]
MPRIPRNRFFEIEDIGHVAIVRFGEQGTGTYYGGEFAELREDIPWLIEELGRHHLLLDLTGIDMLDTRVLGLFILFQRRILQVQGRLVIINLPEPAQEVFRITRLDRIILIASPLGLAKILEQDFSVKFQPQPFAPEWRTRNVVGVAAHLRESGDFSAMPVLADALQDAGCDNSDILDHCRGSGLHARWCPVLELALDLR